MKRILTVARRELLGFLDQATAYILVVAFLALGLFLSFRTLYAAGIATLRPFFDVLPWLFAVFLPAMTMRSLAEERRSGTLEWLLAQPLREPDVVLGKFLGNWLFALVALAGTLPTAIGILLLSEADPGIMVAQYIGAALLAAQGVAIGIWASSLTRNQITAFILAAGVSFSLVLIGTPIVGIGLPPSIAGAVNNLSVMGHFESVARGVIDLRDVIYFVSTAGLFVVVAIGLVARQRLSSERGAFRRLRTGTAALVAAVIFLNLLGGQIHGRVDLTRGGLYTLSDGTRQILADLDDLVTLKVVISDGLPPELTPMVRDVRDLVADLRGAAGGRLIVEELNPNDGEEQETEARNVGVPPTEFNVLRDDQFEVRRGWFGMAMLYADETESFPYVSQTDDLELRLVSAIAKMTTEEKARVGFVTGFGAREPAAFASLQQQLVDRFDVSTVNLQQDTLPVVTTDLFDVLVVGGPTQPMTEEAVARVTGFVSSGGPALIMIDNNQINPQSPMTMAVPSGLEELVAERGVTVRDGMVLDWASNANVSMGRQGIFNVVRPYPPWPIAQRGEDHTTTRDLSNVSVGWASALTLEESESVTPLWVTTEAAVVQPPGGLILPDGLGAPDESQFETLTLAAAVLPEEGSDSGRMIVIGDADFLGDQFVRTNPQNLAFAANAIDWLAQEEALISIRSKTRTPPSLSFTSDFQRSSLKWGNLAGVPILFVLIGIARVTGRRGRAERRWEELAA